MKRTASILAGLFVAAAFFSCAKDNALESQNQENQKTAVIAEKITKKTLRSYIELNGGIEAHNSVKVYPNIAGKITGNFVELGASVKKGDELLLVDPSSPGSIYAVNRITAPISGSIVTVPPRTGTTVSPEIAVITIGDLSKLQIRAYIPERYFSLLKSGLQAEVRVESYPDTVFNAHVDRVSPVVDESSRTVEVIIAFKEADRRITAGMYSKIKLYLKDYEDSLCVPEKAVVLRNGKKTVFTAKNGKAFASEVVTGITVDSEVQVLSGLTEEDFIITEGLDSLQDGTEIRQIF